MKELNFLTCNFCLLNQTSHNSELYLETNQEAFWRCFLLLLFSAVNYFRKNSFSSILDWSVIVICLFLFIYSGVCLGSRYASGTLVNYFYRKNRTFRIFFNVSLHKSYKSTSISLMNCKARSLTAIQKEWSQNFKRKHP